MGFGRELKDFSAGFQVGHRAGMDRRRMKIEEYKNGPPPDDLPDSPIDEPGSGTIPTTPGTDPVKTSSTGGGGKSSTTGDEIAWKGASPEQYALLNTIAGPESGGKYNIIYGGKTFDSFADHPRVAVPIQTGPNAKRTSSAAGKYQFLGSTWDGIAKKYGLKDFSPENQDKAAWYLAAETYGGEDKLMAALKSGDPETIAGVGKALRGQWTSLPGGIEQGTTSNKFVSTFNNYLGKGAKARTDAKDSFDTVEKGGNELLEGGEDFGSTPTAGGDDGDDNIETAEAIPVPEAQTGDLTDWTEFAALDTGGLSDPRDQEARPAMFAEAGGVIPEPAQMFAGGGITTSRTVNPEILRARAVGMAPTSTSSSLAAARQAGMAGGNWSTPPAGAAPAGGPGFTPRRVGQQAANVPGYEPMKMVDGLTPTQLALRTSHEKRVAGEAATAKAAADKAAKAAADTAAAEKARLASGIPSFDDWRKSTLNSGINSKYLKQANTPAGQAALQKQYDLMYNNPAGAEAQKKENIKWNAARIFGFGPFGGGRSLSRGGHDSPGYEEGGVIPEPGAVSYARGGPVEDRDATFQRLLKNETRPGVGRQEARDRAAKRLSALEGRPQSSAYSPHDDGYFTKPKKPKGGGKLPKEAPTPTPRPNDVDPIETGDTGPTPHDTEHERDTSLDDDNEVRVPMPPALEGTPDELKRKAAGTPTSGYDEDGAIPAPADPAAEPDTGFRKSPQSRTGDPMVDPDEPVVSDTSRARPTSPAGPKGQPIPPARRIISEPVIPEPPLPRPDPTQADPAVAPPNVPRPEPVPAAGTPDASGFVPPPPAPPPTSALQPEHAQALSVAKQALAQGAPPQEVLASLRKYGVPIDALPPEMQSQLLGFEEGGVIPDDTVGWSFAEGGTVPEQGERGYNEAVAQGLTAQQPVAAEPEQEDVQATPRLRNDVAVALDSGVKYLTRAFGLGGDDGGIPSPESGAEREQGVKRLASGEGAATQEELAGIDDKIDPDRKLKEGDRNMVRIAKTVQWYLQNGRKDDAEAAAASLMQYGAQRFGKLGSLAGAAYTSYQNGGDPNDLQNTIKFLEKAYEMIPDGANINVTLDESTGKLMTTHTDADGDETVQEVDPSELPGLLQQVQSGSAYWNSIYKLADPEGYRSDLTEKRQLAQEGRTERREGEKNERELKEEAERNKREAEEEAGRNERERTQAEELRLRIKKETDAEKKAELERKLEDQKAKDIDWDSVNPLLDDVNEAKKAMLDPELDSESEEYVSAQEAYYRTLSRLKDALPAKMNRAEWMKANTGVAPEEWDYIAEEKAAEMPPEIKAKHPDAKPGKYPDGTPGWFYIGSDGKPRDATK